MFYSTQILARKGPLGLVWLAAHMDKSVKRNQVFEASIPGTVDVLLSPDMPLALRLSGSLLLGVCKLYARKAAYLQQDCNDVLVKLKLAFKPTAVPNGNAAPHTAHIDAITLPDDLDILAGATVDLAALQPLMDLEVVLQHTPGVYSRGRRRHGQLSDDMSQHGMSESLQAVSLGFLATPGGSQQEAYGFAMDETFDDADEHMRFDLDEIEMERLRSAPVLNPEAAGNNLLPAILGGGLTPAASGAGANSDGRAVSQATSVSASGSMSAMQNGRGHADVGMSDMQALGAGAHMAGMHGAHVSALHGLAGASGEGRGRMSDMQMGGLDLLPDIGGGMDLEFDLAEDAADVAATAVQHQVDLAVAPSAGAAADALDVADKATAVQRTGSMAVAAAKGMAVAAVADAAAEAAAALPGQRLARAGGSTRAVAAVADTAAMAVAAAHGQQHAVVLHGDNQQGLTADNMQLDPGPDHPQAEANIFHSHPSPLALPGSAPVTNQSPGARFAAPSQYPLQAAASPLPHAHDPTAALPPSQPNHHAPPATHALTTAAQPPTSAMPTELAPLQTDQPPNNTGHLQYVHMSPALLQTAQQAPTVPQLSPLGNHQIGALHPRSDQNASPPPQVLQPLGTAVQQQAPPYSPLGDLDAPPSPFLAPLDAPPSPILAPLDAPPSPTFQPMDFEAPHSLNQAYYLQQPLHPNFAAAAQLAAGSVQQPPQPESARAARLAAQLQQSPVPQLLPIGSQQANGQNPQAEQALAHQSPHSTGPGPSTQLLAQQIPESGRDVSAAAVHGDGAGLNPAQQAQEPRVSAEDARPGMHAQQPAQAQGAQQSPGIVLAAAAAALAARPPRPVVARQRVNLGTKRAVDIDKATLLKSTEMRSLVADRTSLVTTRNLETRLRKKRERESAAEMAACRERALSMPAMRFGVPADGAVGALFAAATGKMTAVQALAMTRGMWPLPTRSNSTGSHGGAYGVGASGASTPGTNHAAPSPGGVRAPFLAAPSPRHSPLLQPPQQHPSPLLQPQPAADQLVPLQQQPSPLLQQHPPSLLQPQVAGAHPHATIPPAGPSMLQLTASAQPQSTLALAPFAQTQSHPEADHGAIRQQGTVVTQSRHAGSGQPHLDANGTAINDVAFNDAAVNDIAIIETAFNDVAMDDAALLGDINAGEHDHALHFTQANAPPEGDLMDVDAVVPDKQGGAASQHTSSDKENRPTHSTDQGNAASFSPQPALKRIRTADHLHPGSGQEAALPLQETLANTLHAPNTGVPQRSARSQDLLANAHNPLQQGSTAFEAQPTRSQPSPHTSHQLAALAHGSPQFIPPDSGPRVYESPNLLPSRQNSPNIGPGLGLGSAFKGMASRPASRLGQQLAPVGLGTLTEDDAGTDPPQDQAATQTTQPVVGAMSQRAQHTLGHVATAVLSQLPSGSQSDLTQPATQHAISQTQVSLGALTQGKSRLDASRWFYDMLVLKSRGLVDMSQQSGQDIQVTLTQTGGDFATQRTSQR